MINFKLMKIFIFLYFHVHKNSQINYFNSIFKSGKFQGVTVTEPDDVISHRSVSYNELSFAPNNFSCNNLLGREVWEKFIRAN